MPEHASRRFAAALFDQQSEEHRVADWGGDDLFTRMPRPRVVDDAPPPRFRPQQLEEPAAPRVLALVEPPHERRTEPVGEEWEGPHDRRRDGRTAEAAMQERAERVGLSVIEGDAEPDWEPTVRHPDDGWDRTGQRPMKVLTGHPDGTPRPRPYETSPERRRRPAKTPAEWIGARPERIMAWAFALGLLLILIAITTADAAPL
jgi:hypothetical protein